MNPTKCPCARPRRPNQPNKPLGVFRSWLVEQNYPLVQWVKTSILARRPELRHTHEELTEFLEDAYLRSAQLYDPWKKFRCAGGKWKRLAFTTYAISAMQMSGYRNWMKWVIKTSENTSRSLDAEDEYENGHRTGSKLWANLGVEADPHNQLHYDELLTHITRIVGPTDAALFVQHHVDGLLLTEIADEQGYCRERARQVMARIRDAIRRAMGVVRYCGRCGEQVPGTLVKCPCVRKRQAYLEKRRKEQARRRAKRKVG